MTIPASTAGAARSYLFQSLTAQLAPDMLNKSASLLVCYDDPGPHQPDDIVSVGKVERHISVSSLVGGGGAGWLSESYTIEINIEVYRGGDDPQAVYDRAASLCDAVVAIVRADPSLGGLVLQARPISSSHSVTWVEESMGRLASTTLEIECSQRI